MAVQVNAIESDRRRSMSAEDDMMFMMGSPFGDVSCVGSSLLGSFENLSVLFSSPSPTVLPLSDESTRGRFTNIIVLGATSNVDGDEYVPFSGIPTIVKE